MGNLAEYKSREDAHKDHIDNYRTRGFEKGKYGHEAPDRPRIQKLKDAVGFDKVVLDIGCNDGGLGAYLNQDQRCITYGIDLVKELVDLAVDKGIIAKQGCAEELPFKDNYFEAVVMAEVLEHLYDPREALSEIARVLHPDGVFAGSVPHPLGNMGHGHKADYHQQVFDKDKIHGMLSEYFNEVEITDTPYFDEYCEKYSIDPMQPQWINWTCRGPKE